MPASQYAYTKQHISSIDLAIVVDITGNIQERGLIIQWICTCHNFQTIQVAVGICIRSSGVCAIGLFINIVKIVAVVILQCIGRVARVESVQDLPGIGHLVTVGITIDLVNHYLGIDTGRCRYLLHTPQWPTYIQTGYLAMVAQAEMDGKIMTGTMT